MLDEIDLKAKKENISDFDKFDDVAPSFSEDLEEFINELEKFESPYSEEKEE